MLAINNYFMNLSQTYSSPSFEGKEVKLIKQQLRNGSKEIGKKPQGLFSRFISFLAEKRVKSLTKVTENIDYSECHSIKSGMDGIKSAVKMTQPIK